MNFEAAIFDLDGTILDSMYIWEKIDIDFFNKRGLDLPKNYATDIASFSFIDAAKYTIKLFKLNESVESILEEWNLMAINEYRYNIKLFPHVKNYLRCLKNKGIKLAVATELSSVLYRPCLINNGIISMFDYIFSTEELEHNKEYPDIFYLVANKLDIKPQKCIVFEDTLPAIKSAKQTGMIVYGVYNKYSNQYKREIKNIANGYIANFQHAPIPK